MTTLGHPTLIPRRWPRISSARKERLRDELRQTEPDRERLRREVERLQGQLDATRRAGFRQGSAIAGRRGAHPLQTSAALGAAAVQVGPAVVALSAQLHVQLGVSFGRTVTLLRMRFGLTVSRSTQVRALRKTARQAQPTYAALCATVRGSPVVVPAFCGSAWRTPRPIIRRSRGRGA